MTNRHEIKRQAIREDLIFFAAPALLVFTVGLIFSALDVYDSMLGTIYGLARQPRGILELSLLNLIGLAMFVIGMSIAFIAVGTLRQFYSSTLMIRQGHRLVTHGIYRLTRHPIYLGVIIACIGISVYAESLYGLFAMLALIPIFLYRIRMEERLLTEEYGDAYRTYCEATKKLVPFIY